MSNEDNEFKNHQLDSLNDITAAVKAEGVAVANARAFREFFSTLVQRIQGTKRTRMERRRRRPHR